MKGVNFPIERFVFLIGYWNKADFSKHSLQELILEKYHAHELCRGGGVHPLRFSGLFNTWGSLTEFLQEVATLIYMAGN